MSAGAQATPGPRVEPRASGYPLGWVALLAAIVGAVTILLLRRNPLENPDSYAFDAIARSLLSGGGFVYHEPMFPSVPLYAFRSPGYSAFLALGHLLGGVTAAVAVQGALHGLSAALVGDLARRLAGRGAGWVAFALAFAWPASWYYASQAVSENLFVFMMVLTVWLALGAESRRSLRWAIVAGVAATLMMLVRPTGAGPVAVITVWLALRFPRGALALVLAALVTWLPWPIRNYARLHAFVPFQTMGGVAFHVTHTDQPPVVDWQYMAEHPELGEVGFDRHFAAAAVDSIRARPGAFVRRVARGAFQYAGPLRDRRSETWLHRFALLAVLLALAWEGSRRRLALPALIWVAFGVLVVAVAISVRYRFPSEWCVVLGASIGLSEAGTRWGWRRAAAWSAVALVACIAFTLAVARP